MQATTQDPTRLERERTFFDRVAATAPVRPMSREVFERYARRPHARLFGKEFMFSLGGELRDKRVLEVGCGEGVASCQLAYCGARVTGVDLSPASIEAARRRAEMHGFDVDFRVANVETAELGVECFDVVWCDLILHHLLENLDGVLGRLAGALKPGGLFVAREPVAYSAWLRAVRRFVPVKVDATPDERPLRREEIDLVRRHFPSMQTRHFRVLGRLDRLTTSLPLLRAAGRVDDLILRLPGASSLAGNVVIYARKS